MEQQRATCWSITINNPTDTDVMCDMPGWVLEGQYEAGEEGTRHFQGMLKTPQVRFSAVKRMFPRAHIEVARDAARLRRYVHKPETFIEAYNAEPVLNMFQLQPIIANHWNEDNFKKYWPQKPEIEWGEKEYQARKDAVLIYVDELVANEVRKGRRGVEFIGINPMWRTSWKIFYRAILARASGQAELASVQTDRQIDIVEPSHVEPDPHQREIDEMRAEVDSFGELMSPD